MTDKNNYYYYPPNMISGTPTDADPVEKQKYWLYAQQQLYQQSYPRNNLYGAAANTSSHSAGHGPYRSESYYNGYSPQASPKRSYQQRRYQSNGYNRIETNNYNKRHRTVSEEGEQRSRNPKKRKKPLSQNVPNRKDWTLEEAEIALALEKECNKRHKNMSLLIKFPDLELNKDVVSKFHPAIDNVHFQQPSAPRFCFVTLRPDVDPDNVISALNKQRFGEGFITAEYKKDRDEDVNVGPQDIDPLTLYVGNLAQDITKNDMVKAYPKHHRIDIGYAKKMKYTRYAFVSFSRIEDAIEAFKRTHNTQMHCKSLIVRFRRLHGPVGIPGESKQQNPLKDRADCVLPSEEGDIFSTADVSHIDDNESQEKVDRSEEEHRDANSPQRVSFFMPEENRGDMVTVKQEPEGLEDEQCQSSNNDRLRTSRLKELEAFSKHKPKISDDLVVKKELEDDKPKTNGDDAPIKIEPMDDVTYSESSDCGLACEGRSEGFYGCEDHDSEESDPEEHCSTTVKDFNSLTA